MIRFLQEFWRLFQKNKSKKIEKIKEERAAIEDAPIFLPKKEKIAIQVGLDFGTSATKIAYSIYGKRGIHIINFGHNLPNLPGYCLPSIGAINERGKLILGIDAAKYLSFKEWDLGFQRFKILVAGNYDEKFKDPITEEKFHDYLIKNGLDESFTAERLTAIYLAYAMYNARKYIQNDLKLDTGLIDLSFNICVPIDYIEKNLVLQAFEKIFIWANNIYKMWQIKEESLDPIRASEEFENVTINEDEIRVFAIPEAVAEIASYLASLRKKEGLHAVIDIGAGTTDISIFNLCLHNREGGSKSYWLAARNISKGTINVERGISSIMKEKRINQICSHLNMREYLSTLDKLIGENENIELSKTVREEINKILGGEEYRKVWAEAYNHLRSQTAWEKVEIFIGGGGARLPFVKETLAKPWWENLNTRYPVDLIPPTEDYYEENNEVPFERVAVAYGLAIPKPALDQYVLPLDSPDQTPAPLPCWEYDRDTIYAK